MLTDKNVTDTRIPQGGFKPPLISAALDGRRKHQTGAAPPPLFIECKAFLIGMFFAVMNSVPRGANETESAPQLPSPRNNRSVVMIFGYRIALRRRTIHCFTAPKVWRWSIRQELCRFLFWRATFITDSQLMKVIWWSTMNGRGHE